VFNKRPLRGGRENCRLKKFATRFSQVRKAGRGNSPSVRRKREKDVLYRPRGKGKKKVIYSTEPAHPTNKKKKTAEPAPN